MKSFDDRLNENVAACEQEESHCEFKTGNKITRVLAKQICTPS